MFVDQELYGYSWIYILMLCPNYREHRIGYFSLITKRYKENQWNPGFFPLNVHIGNHFESSAKRSGNVQDGHLLGNSCALTPPVAVGPVLQILRNIWQTLKIGLKVYMPYFAHTTLYHKTLTHKINNINDNYTKTSNTFTFNYTAFLNRWVNWGSR